MDRKIFYNYVRNAPFGGRLLQGQIDGMNAILDEWEKRKLPDLRKLAYMLATTFHETAATMLPVIETRQPTEQTNPSVDTAIQRLETAWAKGRMPWVKTAYWRKNGKGLSYLGRGLPQLTHEDNYAKMSPIVGADLVANPDKALEPKIAIKIMFEGMIRGSFTGKDLGDYFTDGKEDPVNARRIINGVEKAQLVAGYYRSFLSALKAAAADTAAAADATPTTAATPAEDAVKPEKATERAAQADDVKPQESPSVWTIFGGFAGTVVTAAFTALNNPYALAGLVFVLIAGGVGVWMYVSGRLTINRV